MISLKFLLYISRWNVEKYIIKTKKNYEKCEVWKIDYFYSSSESEWYIKKFEKKERKKTSICWSLTIKFFCPYINS